MPTILVDGTTTKYANSTTATAAINSQGPSGCLFEGVDVTGNTRTTFSSSFSGGSLSILSDVSWTTGTFQDIITERLYLTSSGGITIVYNMSTTFAGAGPNGYNISIYADNETTLIDSVGGVPNASGTKTVTIPSDGYYRLYAILLQASSPPVATTSINLSCSGTGMVPCNLRAAYDDGSGGTAYVICA